MPCYDSDRHDDGSAEIKRLHDRNDLMAQILCSISDKLEAEYPILFDELIQENTQYGDWLIAHKKADAERKKAEKARAEKEQRRKLLAAKETLAKLTPEQRHELGLP